MNENNDIQEKFGLVKNIISKIIAPLEESILTESGYQQTKKLSTALTDLHNSLEQAITHSGIRLGFNSRDGD
jgi:predicted lipoprotein